MAYRVGSLHAEPRRCPIVAVDYDAPRVRPEDEPDDAALSALRAGAAKPGRAGTLDDEPDTPAGIDLPGAELSGEFFSSQVVSVAADEFTCTRCYLVAHVSRRGTGGRCRDCS